MSLVVAKKNYDRFTKWEKEKEKEKIVFFFFLFYESSIERTTNIDRNVVSEMFFFADTSNYFFVGLYSIILFNQINFGERVGVNFRTNVFIFQKSRIATGVRLSVLFLFFFFF